MERRSIPWKGDHPHAWGLHAGDGVRIPRPSPVAQVSIHGHGHGHMDMDTWT